MPTEEEDNYVETHARNLMELIATETQYTTRRDEDGRLYWGPGDYEIVLGLVEGHLRDAIKTGGYSNNQ